MKLDKHENGGQSPALGLLSLVLAVVATVLSGCGGASDQSASSDGPEALDAEVVAEERPYFDAGRPFAEAIAARNYVQAYEHLSSHAKARMSPSQFVPPENDATQAAVEASAIRNPTAEQFAQLMSVVEKEFGKPTKLAELHVFSTNPNVLSGNATSTEDKLEALFAIGMMPGSVPADIRKASLRGKLILELNSFQLAEAAKALQTTPESLKSDPDFKPYVNLKMVLVEDAGALKVGYFEFVPPNIFD